MATMYRASPPSGFIATLFGGRYPLFRRPADIVLLAFGLLKVWADRARQRRELAALNERDLEDIGLTRLEARHEAAKPFWQA